MSKSAEISIIYSLIGLRALADLDPQEYCQICDASRGGLDHRIDLAIQNLGNDHELCFLNTQVRELRGFVKGGGWNEERGRLAAVQTTCRSRSIIFAFKATRGD
jgi:hypothetical protein